MGDFQDATGVLSGRVLELPDDGPPPWGKRSHRTRRVRPQLDLNGRIELVDRICSREASLGMRLYVCSLVYSSSYYIPKLPAMSHATICAGDVYLRCQETIVTNGFSYLLTWDSFHKNHCLLNDMSFLRFSWWQCVPQCELNIRCM